MVFRAIIAGVRGRVALAQEGKLFVVAASMDLVEGEDLAEEEVIPHNQGVEGVLVVAAGVKVRSRVPCRTPCIMGIGVISMGWNPGPDSEAFWDEIISEEGQDLDGDSKQYSG